MASQEWLEKDFYHVLGVAESASATEITKAYRKLAKQLHPDTNPGGEERFKEVAVAYDVLGNSETRREYDALREAARNPGPRYSTSSSHWGQSPFGPDLNLDDILSNFFSPRAAQNLRGRDYQMRVDISFEEAVRGCSKILPTWQEEPCAKCQGRGVSGDSPCQSCAGTGRVEQRSEISVRIPAGVDEGSRIRIPGHGEFGAGGRGDLYLVLGVGTDTRFVRDGRHLRCSANVSVFDALLGATIQVESLDGPVKLRVPAGTQPGTTLRLKGRGVKAGVEDKDGDLLVEIRVAIPTKLTKAQRTSVEALREDIEGRDHG